MKRITLPAPAQFGDESSPEVSAEKYIRETILTLNFWKTGGLERIEAAFEIDDALTKDPSAPIVSNDTANLWGEAMQLLGPNGTSVGGVMNPKANMFFLRIQRAVLRAETVKEEKAKEEPKAAE